jgi:hypothetical protein
MAVDGVALSAGSVLAPTKAMAILVVDDRCDASRAQSHFYGFLQKWPNGTSLTAYSAPKSAFLRLKTVNQGTQIGEIALIWVKP